MLGSHRVESKRDWAQIFFLLHFQKDGLMVRAAKGKNFSGDNQAKQEEIVLNQETVESGRNVPGTEPPIGPGIFP